MKKIVVGITGASGSIYAKRLIEELIIQGVQTNVVCTELGKQVFKFEIGISLEQWIDKLKQEYSNVKLEDNNNLFSGVASGSNKYDAVIISPCSMGTLADIANGMSKNLLCRCADVALKEKRRLIIVPRETPFSSIHLENMLKLSNVGASIIPAIPGFYHKPQTMDDLINFVVGKILDHIDIENNLFKKWEEE